MPHGKSKKWIGIVIVLLLMIPLLICIGNADPKSSDGYAEEEETVTEEQADGGYDVQYDENGNMTPESMENIASRELHKGMFEELTEEEQKQIYSEIMEQEAADEYVPPTGAKP